MTDTLLDDAPIADALNALLDNERAALLTGDFDAIAALAEEKQRLVGELAGADISLRDLAPLQEKLRRNHELFDHALTGIRRVTARLDALREIHRSMDTYDALGRKTTIPAAAAKKLERRA